MEQNERIAKLEVTQEQIMLLLQETKAEMKQMRDEVHSINKSLTRWKGIGAGIVITVSILWTGIIGVYQFVSGR